MFYDLCHVLPVVTLKNILPDDLGEWSGHSEGLG